MISCWGKHFLFAPALDSCALEAGRSSTSCWRPRNLETEAASACSSTCRKSRLRFRLRGGLGEGRQASQSIPGNGCGILGGRGSSVPRCLVLCPLPSTCLSSSVRPPLALPRAPPLPPTLPHAIRLIVHIITQPNLPQSLSSPYSASRTCVCRFSYMYLSFNSVTPCPQMKHSTGPLRRGRKRERWWKADSCPCEAGC